MSCWVRGLASALRVIRRSRPSHDEPTALSGDRAGELLVVDLVALVPPCEE